MKGKGYGRQTFKYSLLINYSPLTFIFFEPQGLPLSGGKRKAGGESLRIGVKRGEKAGGSRSGSVLPTFIEEGIDFMSPDLLSIELLELIKVY